jgi:hypothetical protein
MRLPKDGVLLNELIRFIGRLDAAIRDLVAYTIRLVARIPLPLGGSATYVALLLVSTIYHIL